MLRSFLKWAMVVCLGLFCLAYFKAKSVPHPEKYAASFLPEPEQKTSLKKPFQVAMNGVDYTITPLYQYHLKGVVVSQHQADGFTDYLHKQWNDHLNVTDLCVLWGDNVKSGAYQNFDFWNLQFTCNFYTDSWEAFNQFHLDELSNNHLLTDDKFITQTLKNVQIGDEVEIRGHLVEYAHNAQGQNFHRGTSTVRTDTGNGACETIFIDTVEIIQSPNKMWRTLKILSLMGLLLMVVGWFMQPVKFNDS